MDSYNATVTFKTEDFILLLQITCIGVGDVFNKGKVNGMRNVYVEEEFSFFI